MDENNPYIVNPHLNGTTFILEGSHQGILLVHGFTATTSEVRPLAEILNHQGYTVTGPLLPGHFTKPTDLNQVTWQDWYAEVETSFNYLYSRCTKVVVGGESTGGLLALHLAAKHPEVAGILTYAPALLLNTSFLDTLKIHIFAPFIQYVNKQNMGIDELWQGYNVIPLKGTLQLLKLQKQVMSDLTKIHQPLLIIQGRKDITVHPKVPDIIYDTVSSNHKEKYWMEHSAHCVILDNELADVGNLTIRFLKSIPTT